MLVVYLARDHPVFLQEYKEEVRGILLGMYIILSMIHIKHVLTCLQCTHKLNNNTIHLVKGDFKGGSKLWMAFYQYFIIWIYFMERSVGACLHTAYTIISVKVSWL